jgi:hypothetical protein
MKHSSKKETLHERKTFLSGFRASTNTINQRWTTNTRVGHIEMPNQSRQPENPVYLKLIRVLHISTFILSRAKASK